MKYEKEQRIKTKKKTDEKIKKTKIKGGINVSSMKGK